MDSSTVSGMIDVHGMLREASTPLSVQQLLWNGVSRLRVISGEKMDDLINRSVRTIVDKYRFASSPGGAPSARQIATESKAEFKGLVQQYQETADVTSAVEASKQALAQEFRQTRLDLDPENAVSPASGAEGRENAMLKRRIEKLSEHVATMEAALKTLSSAKTFSNQHVQNLLRDLGLTHEDKNFEKKKEMLRVVLNENQGIRRQARELAARGISLEAPEGTTVSTFPPIVAASSRRSA